MQGKWAARRYMEKAESCVQTTQQYNNHWGGVTTKQPTSMAKYLSRDRALAGLTPVRGGTPIDYHTAKELRCVVLGSALHGFSADWKRAALVYQQADSSFRFGLCAPKRGSRAVVMCIQAFIIKNLVFKYKSKEEINTRNVLEPTEAQRMDALVTAVSEVIWRSGQEVGCYITLPQEEQFFESTLEYKKDGITEKLHIFDFKAYEDVKQFMKRHISHFGGDNGCILLVYSLVLSRGIKEVQKDSGCKEVVLVSVQDECSKELLHLMVTGRAVRHHHNGTLHDHCKGELYDKPLLGVPERGPVGFLCYNEEEDPVNRTTVGSMLKTPKKPIWVTLINDVHYGLLFCMNPDLMRDWRTEQRFTLHYYTGLQSQSMYTQLSVDTMLESHPQKKYKQEDEESNIPALEHLILSKWPAATIDWNGTMPFV